MISRIDHVSIAVKEHKEALHFFQNILGAIPGVSDEDHDMQYFWHMFTLGDLSRLELIHPTRKGSFLSHFLEKNKNGGLHHISLQTPDIQKAIHKLEDNDIPYFGYTEYGGIWKEIFIHPKDAFGVLIQIAEFNPDDWLDPSIVFPKGQRWEIIDDKKGCTLSVAHPGGGKVKLQLTTTEIKKLISDLEKLC